MLAEGEDLEKELEKLDRDIELRSLKLRTEDKKEDLKEIITFCSHDWRRDSKWMRSSQPWQHSVLVATMLTDETRLLREFRDRKT